jgi:hypothetical protein
MIGIAIGIIAYLFASTGAFGGDLIYALDAMENWYWIVLVLVSILAIIVFLVFSGMGAAMGADVAGKVGGFTGAAAGSILGVISALAMLAKSIIMLVIVTWLIGNIDPTAANFDALSTKQVVGLVGLLILIFLPVSKGSKIKMKSR